MSGFLGELKAGMNREDGLRRGEKNDGEDGEAAEAADEDKTFDIEWPVSLVLVKRT